MPRHETKPTIFASNMPMHHSYQSVIHITQEIHVDVDRFCLYILYLVWACHIPLNMAILFMHVGFRIKYCYRTVDE